QLAVTQDIPRVRQRILTEALTIYQQFLHEKGDDPAVRHRTADAYRRVGDIQSELGQPAQAEASYRQAIGLADKLVADFPGAPEYCHDLAFLQSQLGTLLRDQRLHAESEALHREALRLRKELAVAHPDHQPNRRHVSSCYRRLGLLLWDRHEWAAA